jgi:UPF0176 protein
MNYRVLLFYKYVGFDNPEQFRDEHLRFCSENDILEGYGFRKKGFNGTVSGTTGNIENIKMKSELSRV